MSELHAIWITSLFGAVVFYAAGLLTGRRGKGAALAAKVVPVASSQEESLQSQLSEKERLIKKLHSNELGAKATIATLQQSVESAVADRNQFKLRFTDAESKHAAYLQKQAAANPAPPSPLVFTQKTNDQPESDSSRLQYILNIVANATQASAVVLADKSGLPLAVVGDYGHELAAYASMVAGLANKTNTFVPVEFTDHATFVDNNGTTISVWPFEADQENFSLTIFSKTSLIKHAAQVSSTVKELRRCFIELSVR